MRKSLLLLASFVGFVACNQEKKDDAAAQTTEEACPAETPAAAEKPAVPAVVETATPAPTAEDHGKTAQ